MIRRFRTLWRNIFSRKRLNDDLDEEVRGYLELIAAEKMRSCWNACWRMPFHLREHRYW